MTWAFWLAVAFIWSHELDAMTQKEWRLLPVLRSLPDDQGRKVFVWLHLPLFVGTAAIVAAGPTSIVGYLLSAFCIVHVGLHHMFRNHPAYTFHSATSRLLIVGAGVFGAIHISLALWG